MGKLENLARERIVRWRKQHGVSQERLGKVTGAHQTTVGKWERGDASVDIDTLAAWARFFGHTLLDLIAHEDISVSPDADFVGAYNALPSDEARKAILGVMLTYPGREKRNAPKRGAKRGTD
jgi:transcriptional regulator with XRE-family HTH domain